MSEKDLNVDIIIKNQKDLIEGAIKGLETNIEKIAQAKKEKQVEQRIEHLKQELESMKKFLENDGYNKEIEHAKKEIEELKEGNLIKKGLPTLVDFWADWCAPCRYIGPLVHQLKHEYQGKLNVLQVDTETKVGDKLFREFAIPFGVNGIPYLIVFDKDGKIFERLVGANPEKLQEMVEAVLKK